MDFNYSIFLKSLIVIQSSLNSSIAKPNSLQYTGGPSLLLSFSEQYNEIISLLFS